MGENESELPPFSWTLEKGNRRLFSGGLVRMPRTRTPTEFRNGREAMSFQLGNGTIDRRLLVSLAMTTMVSMTSMACGSGSDEPPLTTFEMKGTVDLLMGTLPFAVQTGDPLSGTFSFDPRSSDSYADPKFGHYIQAPPAQAEFALGEIQFRSDTESRSGYYIDVENDDASVLPTRDIVRWVSSDPKLSADFGVDEVQASMTLMNLDASAFTDDSLPSQLDMKDFQGNMFLSGASQTSKAGATIFWNLRVRVDSIQRRTP